jgi:hypothetical protein
LKPRRAHILGQACCLLCALLAVFPASSAGAQSPQPIAGAGNWVLLERLGQSQDCLADLHGDEVDVHLMENRLHKMLLVAGKPSWRLNPETIDFYLKIDDGPDMPLKGDGVINLFLTPVNDALQPKLSSAASLRWRLPWGEYHASVTGLGKAFDALKACNKKNGGPH